MAKKRAKVAKQKRGAKRVSRVSRGRAKRSPSAASAVAKDAQQQALAAARRFSSGVVARGEAVPAGTPLPPGATHEIVGYDADGAPLLARKRFSAV